MKFSVTPELATLIKTLRMQNAISAKDLATYLSKSPSYISKLENGNVKSIHKDELTELLMYITGSDCFEEEVLPTVVRTLSSFTDTSRMPSQIWLLHYDVIERQIPVPEEMISDMEERMRVLDTSLSEQVSFINANIDAETLDSLPANELLLIDYKGEERLMYRSVTDEKNLQDLFLKKVRSTNYMTLYYLSYTLFRFSIFGKEERKMPPKEAIEVLQTVDLYMEQYNIRSFMNFSQLISSEEFIRHQLPMVSSFRNANPDYMNEIIDFFQQATEKNALNTAMILKNMRDMLSWDPAFTMKLFSLPFAELDDLSYQKKKNLISEITDLLAKYEQMSDIDRKWEDY